MTDEAARTEDVPVSDAAAEHEASLEPLLDYLKRARGFDFTGYKRSSLERRVSRRMAAVDAGSYAEYVDYLEVQPDEISYLFNAVLINVTEFFRDPPAWEYVREHVIPKLLSDRDDGGALRIWSAGCASGEEAVTIAMLLVEAMGEQDFRHRVKVYGTDVDEEALSQARAAVFTAKQMEPVPEHLRDRCFERLDQRWVLRPDLRRALIFGRNDLVQDAPISRIDLLACRNTLMYFNAEAQERILMRFNFALNDTGYLLLGKSEMLLAHRDLFVPVNLKRRVFAKVSPAPLRNRLIPYAGEVALSRQPAGAGVRDRALDALPTAQIVVDAEGRLVMANQRARELLGLSNAELGRPIHELSLSYRPVDIRSPLEEVSTHRMPVELKSVEWPPNAGQRGTFDLRVQPLIGDGEFLGASITYADVTEDTRLRLEFERARRELEGAYEELQSTVEELETTNEELQSTNEELETMNEELQSTNEELETMNEELQSTNEELETANDELRVRGVEIDEVNALLETIMTSLGVAVVVVDSEQVVQIWNAASQSLWGIAAHEAEGRHLQSLDIGLPLEMVSGPVADVLALRSSREDLVVDAVNRRGRQIRCKVSILLMRDADQVPGALLLMEHVDGH